MEEAWTFHERNLYSRALTNRVNVFTGAILDSRRDGVQVHIQPLSRPPSLTVAEGGLYSRLFVEDGQDVFCWPWPLPHDEAKLPRRMVQV